VSSQYGRERGGDMHNLRAPGQVRDVQAARRARAQHPREPLRGGVPRGPRPLFVRSLSAARGLHTPPRGERAPPYAPPTVAVTFFARGLGAQVRHDRGRNGSGAAGAAPLRLLSSSL